MHVKKANVVNFGHFRNHVVDFGAGVNVVLGPNEAGKSTLVEFLRYMLLGKDKNQRHVPTLDGSAPVGRLWLSDGHSIERKNYRREDGSTGALELGAAESVFRDVFTFSLHDLNTFGDIGDGDRAFMGALSESIQKHELALSAINGRIKELYRDRSQDALLRRLESRKRELSERLTSAEKFAATYSQIQETISRLNLTRGELTELITANRLEQGFLALIQSHYPTWNSLQTSREQLDHLRAFEVAPEEAALIRDLRTELRTVEQEHQRLIAKLDGKAALRGQIEFNQELIDIGDELTRRIHDLDSAGSFNFEELRTRLDRERRNLDTKLKDVGAASAESVPTWTIAVQSQLREAARLENLRVSNARKIGELARQLEDQTTKVNAIVLDSDAEDVSNEIGSLPEPRELEELKTTLVDLEAKVDDLFDTCASVSTDLRKDHLAQLEALALEVPKALSNLEQQIDLEQSARERLTEFESEQAEVSLIPLDREKVEALRAELPNALMNVVKRKELDAEVQELKQRIEGLALRTGLKLDDLETIAMGNEMRAQLLECAENFLARKRELERAQEDVESYADVSQTAGESIEACKRRVDKLRRLEQLVSKEGGQRQNGSGQGLLIVGLVALALIALFMQSYLMFAGLLVLVAIALWFWSQNRKVETRSEDTRMQLKEVSLPLDANASAVFEARQHAEIELERLSTLELRVKAKTNSLDVLQRRARAVQSAEERWSQLTRSFGLDVSVSAARDFVNSLDKLEDLKSKVCDTQRTKTRVEANIETFSRRFHQELGTLSGGLVNAELSREVSNWLNGYEQLKAKRTATEDAREQLRQCTRKLEEARVRVERLAASAQTCGFQEELETLPAAIQLARRSYELKDQLEAAEAELARAERQMAPTRQRIEKIRSKFAFEKTDEELVEYAKARLQQAQLNRGQWRIQEAKRKELAGALNEQETRLSEVHQEIEAGPLSWNDAITKFPILSDASPQSLENLIVRVSEIHRSLENVNELKSDLQRAEGKLLAAQKEVELLRDRLDVSTPLERWIPTVVEELNDAREKRARFERIDEECAELREHIVALENAKASVKADLEKRLLDLDCESSEDFEKRFAEGQEFVTTKEKIENETQVLKNAFGKRFPDAEVEFELGDPLEWERVESELTATEKELKEEFETLGEELWAAQKEREDLESNSDIQTIQIELVAVEGEIYQARVELAELLIAKAYLERTMEVYRKEHMPGVLKTASEMIREATAGAYVSLLPSDDAKDILLEDALGGRRTAEELSRGTRELVFIALRLALAMDYASRGVKLPIIMDDVLVNLDEERAAQVAGLISAVGQHHQILFMTCSPQTAELLDECCDGCNQIEIRRFGGAEQPMAFSAVNKTSQGQSGDLTPEKVLHTLEAATEPLSKSAILEMSGCSDSRWTSVIADLKMKGLVIQTGERSGAKYSLNHTNTYAA